MAAVRLRNLSRPRLPHEGAASARFPAERGKSPGAPCLRRHSGSRNFDKSGVAWHVPRQASACLKHRHMEDCLVPKTPNVGVPLQKRPCLPTQSGLLNRWGLSLAAAALLHIPVRRCAEQSFVVAIELGDTFIPHGPRGIGCPFMFCQHEPLCFAEPQLLDVLHGAQSCEALEISVQRRR